MSATSTSVHQPLLLMELNELNFDFVQRYREQGKLPILNALIARHGVSETTSENAYEDLEPWIQWVSAHTGQTLAQHGVFRLGDIVGRDLPQIWEQLEDSGVRVGAISPMNANNRTRHAAFFVPDPWTKTEITGSALVKAVYSAIAQAVNDNASSRISLASAAKLLAGLVFYARPVNYGRYLRMVMKARSRPWLRTAFLDLFLADLFFRLTKGGRPGFASLFLNAGAHVQHHYMFSSAAYDGPARNPPWYVPAGADPLFDIYDIYDQIIGQVISGFPDHRIMIATGLHQVPYPKVTYYWRLRDHAKFLKGLGVSFREILPRMSRDFVVVCDDPGSASGAEADLLRVLTASGGPLFEVDNRGSDLFVTLAFAGEITDETIYQTPDGRTLPLKPDVAFVAIKNGEHDGVGYLVDTGTVATDFPRRIPLTDLPGKIATAIHGVRASETASSVAAE